MFGLRQYGVDINGYVNDPEKGLCVWMQRRSVSKPTWPGKWDNFVCKLMTDKHYNLIIFQLIDRKIFSFVYFVNPFIISNKLQFYINTT